ncbi:hypothetical protein KAJ89_05555 [Candidatus Parcubacteria bacterium]|nr:hypothetical protein [Candidatus Parcubacteria bacterium]
MEIYYLAESDGEDFSYRGFFDKKEFEKSKKSAIKAGNYLCEGTIECKFSALDTFVSTLKGEEREKFETEMVRFASRSHGFFEKIGEMFED